MRRDLLEVVTVGLPFCCFKLLAGLSLWNSAPSSALRVVGGLLLALGALDALINGVNLVGLIVYRRRPLAACALAFATLPMRTPSGSPRQWHDLGTSLDVLLSFVLVASMIGFGRLKALPPEHLALWNACVIFNVLGAGLTRFGASVRDITHTR